MTEQRRNGPPGEPLSVEHEAFLAEHTKVFLLVRRGDGTPTGYPMTGIWSEGALEFSTYRKSAKVRRIERDDRVCCVVVPWDWYPGCRSLLLWGHCRVSETGPDHWASSATASSAPVGIDVPTEIHTQVAERTRDHKRVVLRVEPLTATFVSEAS